MNTGAVVVLVRNMFNILSTAHPDPGVFLFSQTRPYSRSSTPVAFVSAAPADPASPWPMRGEMGHMWGGVGCAMQYH